MNRTLICAAILGIVAAGAAVAAELRTPNEVTSALQAAGYSEVRDVEFDDGLWEAEVRRDSGRWSDVHVDPSSGEVLDAATATLLSAAEVIALLVDAGYQVRGDVDREDALWEVEVTDAQGQRLDLRVDGRNGRVLYSEIDHND